MAAALLDRLHGGSPWWPRLAVAAAAVALVLAAVRLFWLLMAGPALPPLPPVANTPTLSTAAPTGSLAQWHLFGNALAGDPHQLVEQAPETALRLLLRGTLAEPDPAGGIAIIADEGGVERAYRVGDELPGGARLAAVHADHVLLGRDGRTETLSLPKASDSGAPGSAGQASRPRVSSPGANTDYPGFVRPLISPGAPQLDTRRALAGTQVAELAKQVNVLPVLENGRFAGVRLSVGRDSDLLAKHGLRSSDVITAVNGIPLDGPQRQAELMTSLRDAHQVTLTVRRDGKTLTIPVGL